MNKTISTLAIALSLAAGCGHRDDGTATRERTGGSESMGPEIGTASEEPTYQEQTLAEQSDPNMRDESALGAPATDSMPQDRSIAQGEEPMQQPMQENATPEGALMLRAGEGSEVTVREVVLHKDRNGNQHLIFFREDVECSDLARVPTRRDESLLAMTRLGRTQGEMQNGPLPSSQWTVRSGERTRTARGGEGTINITNATPGTTEVQGRVNLEADVAGEHIALTGPFTATVCDVREAARIERENRARSAESEATDPTDPQASNEPTAR
jgi:hypothetical protein